MDLPSDDALRWLVRTYARLRARYGEAIGTPALVQPTAEFFPDEFRLEASSVERFLRRILGYARGADAGRPPADRAEAPRRGSPSRSWPTGTASSSRRPM